jgi:hypothetical protein
MFKSQFALKKLGPKLKGTVFVKCHSLLCGLDFSGEFFHQILKPSLIFVRSPWTKTWSITRLIPTQDCTTQEDTSIHSCLK